MFANLILFFGCGGPPKHEAPKINAKHTRIYVEPFKNMSTIELAKGFPRDTGRVNTLFQEIEKAHYALIREISLNGKSGLYKIVDYTDYPNLIVTPALLPYKLEKDKLLLPVLIKTNNTETGERFKQIFDVNVVFPTPDIPTNTYHFWGVMLAEWRRHIPKKDIAALFYGKRKD